MSIELEAYLKEGSALPSNIHVLNQLKAAVSGKINEFVIGISGVKSNTAEERTQVEALTRLERRTNDAIARNQRYATFVAPQTPSGFNIKAPGGEARNHTRQSSGWLSRLMAEATDEQRDEIEHLVAITTGRISASANLSPTGDGGNLIPSFVASQIELHVAAFTPVLNNSRIYSTETGAKTIYPVVTDTESAVQLASMALTGLDDVVSGDVPVTALTGVELDAYKMSSKPMLVPRELLLDSGVDFTGDFLTTQMARIARFENLKYTTGSGIGEPQGFTTACIHYDVTTPLDLDMALDLTQIVEPLYRPKGIFMAHDTTWKYLMKLKTGISGDKRPLWSFADSSGDGTGTEGRPTGLWGYPCIVNNDLPPINSSGYISGHELCFGDFSRFLIRRAENGVPFVYSWPVPAKDGRALMALRRSDANCSFHKLLPRCQLVVRSS